MIAEMIHDINPFAQVDVYDHGIDTENIEEFIVGADVVADETEYMQHELGVMIAREARKNSLPVVMSLNVGFGSYTVSFNPHGRTFESYLGLDEAMAIDDIATADVPFSNWVRHLPSYSDMTAFKAVSNGETSTPTVAPGVNIAAAEGATQLLAHLLSDINPARRKWVNEAPSGQVLDVVDGRRRVGRSRLHFLGSAAIAYARTKFGLNPKTSHEL